MKHLYSLVILVCLALTGRSQANSYFNNNPCWQIRSMCQVGSNCFKVDYYNYFINGDSVIGPNQYKKVYMKGYGNNQYFAMGPPPSGNPCAGPPPTTYTLSTFAFLIRSTAKKMYVYPSSSTGDTLLYDFNLNVGDTLPTTYNNFSGSNIKVTAIDSINTANGWMKRFQLSGSSTSTHLVEGMGHYGGLIELLPINVTSCGWSLQCYSQNNTAYYPSSGPSCLLSTTIKEPASNNRPIVYPNPSIGKFKVYLNQFSTNSKIEIYSVTGQLIDSFVPQVENVEIDLGKERDGVYFLNYISNGETRSVKLIKE